MANTDMKILDAAHRRATLLKEKRVVHADARHVKAVAGNLEAMLALTEEMHPYEQVPISMSVVELQHFVSYMRGLDTAARDCINENAALKAQNSRLQSTVDDNAAAIVRLETALRAGGAKRTLYLPTKKTGTATSKVFRPKKARK